MDLATASTSDSVGADTPAAIPRRMFRVGSAFRANLARLAAPAAAEPAVARVAAPTRPEPDARAMAERMAQSARAFPAALETVRAAPDTRCAAPDSVAWRAEALDRWAATARCALPDMYRPSRSARSPADSLLPSARRPVLTDCFRLASLMSRASWVLSVAAVVACSAAPTSRAFALNALAPAASMSAWSWVLSIALSSASSDGGTGSPSGPVVDMASSSSLRLAVRASAFSLSVSSVSGMDSSKKPFSSRPESPAAWSALEPPPSARPFGPPPCPERLALKYASDWPDW